MSARTQELLSGTDRDGAPDGDTAEAGSARPETAPRAWRILGLAAVCLGLAALAAATFVLSYSGIRAVALEAGITPRLARGYPLLVDAMLVIALAAVLALRGAGLPSKVLAWLTLLVVLAAAAGADGLHAVGRTLPHRPVSRDYCGRIALGAGVHRVRAAALHASACQTPAGRLEHW